MTEHSMDNCMQLENAKHGLFIFHSGTLQYKSGFDSASKRLDVDSKDPSKDSKMRSKSSYLTDGLILKGMRGMRLDYCCRSALSTALPLNDLYLTP